MSRPPSPFYRDALGLEIVNDVVIRRLPLGELRLRRSARASRSCSPSPRAGRSPEDADALQRLAREGFLPRTATSSPPPTSTPTFERLRASGAEVLQEPIEQAWGPRDCAFRDPAGNHIRMNQA